MNLLEKGIAAVAPVWALRRAAARARLGLALQAADRVRHYEGADRGRRTQGWHAVDSSANSATSGALHTLRARCRDLRRNNPWAQAAVRELASNVAGRGIRPRFTHETDAELRRAREVWEEWAGWTQADAAGRDGFNGMQAAVVEAVVDGGEILLRRRLRRDEDPLAVPLQLQLLEGDHLDTLKDFEADEFGNKVIQGVAFDAIGRRAGYWIHPEHPGDSFTAAGFAASRFVPASEVRHPYRLDRTGQVRGIPWGAVIALLLHDFDKYQDFEQMRMLVATAYAGFVIDQSGADASFTDGISGALAGESNQNRLRQPVDEIHSGTVEYLGPGKDIRFTAPPQNEGFEGFARIQLRAVAQGYGVPPWLLSGDFSGLPFSAIRASWISFNRELDLTRDRILIPHFCEPAVRWWRSAAELVDVLTPGVEDGSRLRWEWIPPRREMLDPRTEVTAEIEAVRAGFKPLSAVISSLGSDPDRVLDALAADLASAKAKGLTLSTDGANPAPGRTPTPNQAQAANGKPPPKDEDEEEGEGEGDDEEDRLARLLLARLGRRGFSPGDAVAQLVGP